MEEEKEYDYDTLVGTLRDVFDALEVISHLAEKCLDHPNSKEHRTWRIGLLQVLAAIQEQVAEAIAEDCE